MHAQHIGLLSRPKKGEIAGRCRLAASMLARHLISASEAVQQDIWANV